MYWVRHSVGTEVRLVFGVGLRSVKDFAFWLLDLGVRSV